MRENVHNNDVRIVLESDKNANIRAIFRAFIFSPNFFQQNIPSSVCKYSIEYSADIETDSFHCSDKGPVGKSPKENNRMSPSQYRLENQYVFLSNFTNCGGQSKWRPYIFPLDYFTPGHFVPSIILGDTFSPKFGDIYPPYFSRQIAPF
jgi:hypothetical protein